MGNLTGATLSGQYFLRELAGSGGMADVYLAWDKHRTHWMAIKVLRQDLTNNQTFLEQFTTEADIYRQLNHPNIVRFYEFKQDAGNVYIVMDWVEGSDLRTAIRNSRDPLPYSYIVQILQSICPALHYAHTLEGNRSIYHCDVKPANIMLQIDGKILLTDFGVANLAWKNTRGGTPPYMAPEQFNGGKIDSRTDVYAMGITLYEIISGGKTPYRGETATSRGTTPKERIEWEHLNLPPPPLEQFNPNVPPAIAEIVYTAINKNPDKRYSSMLDLRDAFVTSYIKSGGENELHNHNTVDVTSLAQGKQYHPANHNVSVDVPAPRQNNNNGPIPNPFGDDLPSVIASTIKKITNPRIFSKSPRLFCRAGQFSGSTFELPHGELVLGRSKNCQIILNEPSVSRRHATIIHSKHGTYIRDDASSLGTYVNNFRIDGPVLLRNKDIIQVGYEQIFEYLGD